MLLHKRILCAIVGALIVTNTHLAASEFQRLLANPSSFHHKVVTISGVMDVYSNGFFLHEKPLTESKLGGLGSVFVTDRDGLLPSKFDRHWLKITGMVDASAHGPLGTEPCEIRLKDFKVLPFPPLKDESISAIFRNETSSTLRLRIITKDGYSVSTLEPGAITTERIDNATAVATIPSGAAIAKLALNRSQSGEDYFDSRKRRYFYRIAHGEIKLVKREIGQRWFAQGGRIKSEKDQDRSVNRARK